MATVTRKFKANFLTFAAHRVATGQWSDDDVAELQASIRADLYPGPDLQRAGLVFVLASGVEIPASIDDHEERYRLWDEFFEAEAEAINQIQEKEA
ncbi:MAG: hypothetical protein IPF44_06865 [Betaproteobacteria bacterium]|nr:hypothetical protein [Betaproteobacteria bacterium]MBK6356448.1 hypothetical protein [Betaproteobacteria bacterium]